MPLYRTLSTAFLIWIVEKTTVHHGFKTLVNGAPGSGNSFCELRMEKMELKLDFIFSCRKPWTNAGPSSFSLATCTSGRFTYYLRKKSIPNTASGSKSSLYVDDYVRSSSLAAVMILLCSGLFCFFIKIRCRLHQNWRPHLLISSIVSVVMSKRKKGITLNAKQKAIIID